MNINWTAGKIVAIILAVFLTIASMVGIKVVSDYFSYHDYGVRVENQLEAESERAFNLLSSATMTIADLSNVNDRYVDDLRGLVQDTMNGRYGDDGAGEAMMLWMQERNIELDSSMYRDINDAIRSGREDYSNAQSRITDIRRSYENNLDSMWSGMFLRMHGFPKVDLSEYDVILDEQTSRIRETRVMESFL